MTIGGERVAFTTDTYVVSPRFFPGGDIGTLAVYGTVNDLAMAGATTALPERRASSSRRGCRSPSSSRVVRSMRDTAAACGVALVTGDTKVVDRGKGDGLFINTAGIGRRFRPASTSARNGCQPGDVVLVSGDVGRHGIAVLPAREGLAFEPPIESDCAPLADLVAALLDAGVDVHCLRDPDPRRAGRRAQRDRARPRAAGSRSTRRQVPVDPTPSRAPASCSGSIRSTWRARDAWSPSSHRADADRALAVLRAHPLGAGAARIGVVEPGPAGEVVAITAFGGERLLDLPLGEPLPRIC